MEKCIEERLNDLEKEVKLLKAQLKQVAEMVDQHTDVFNSFGEQSKKLEKELDEELPNWRTMDIRKELNDWFGIK